MKGCDKATAIWGKVAAREVVVHSHLSLETPCVRGTSERAGFFIAAVCATWALTGSYFASAGNFYLLPCATIVFPVRKDTPNMNIFLFCQIESFYFFCVCSTSFKEGVS